MLRSTQDMEEQGDMLHYMAEQFGMGYKVTLLDRFHLKKKAYSFHFSTKVSGQPNAQVQIVS